MPRMLNAEVRMVHVALEVRKLVKDPAWSQPDDILDGVWDTGDTLYDFVRMAIKEAGRG